MHRERCKLRLYAEKPQVSVDARYADPALMANAVRPRGICGRKDPPLTPIVKPETEMGIRVSHLALIARYSFAVVVRSPLLFRSNPQPAVS
jgi:hypothetical protein